jgi:hypothetical protein
LFIKPLSKPFQLQQLESLEMRFSAHHPKLPAVREQLIKHAAGFRGETTLNYFLRELPHDHSFLFHDIRLPSTQNQFFQMDFLLLKQNYALILEVKDYAGAIQMNNVKRALERDGKSLPNPTHQVERHRHHLTNWLVNNGTPPMPIETAIVFSNETVHADLPFDFMYPYELPAVLDRLEKRHRENLLTEQAIQRLTKRILAGHTPDMKSVLPSFHLTPADIVTGVHCTKCKKHPMIRLKRKWHCARCGRFHTDDHITALHDYLLLISPTITTAQCAAFLHLDSTYIAYRLLTKMNLPTSGGDKNKKYHLSSFNWPKRYK